MHVNRCHNRGCPQPAQLFDSPDPFKLFCSDRCQEQEHRRLRGIRGGMETRSSKPRRPVTLSVRSAFQELADEAARFNPFHGNKVRDTRRKK
jgi:hypothetical protein